VTKIDTHDELDIDTSDLPAFVQRCNTNTTTNLIPESPSNVQTVILNRNSTEPQNTQQFMNESANANHQCDFTSHPWRWAEQFIQFHDQHKLISHANIVNYFFLIHPIIICKAIVHHKVMLDNEIRHKIAIELS